MDYSLEKFENLKDYNPVLLLEAVITRALTNANIPRIFNRSKLAILDLDRAIADKNIINFGNETQAQVYAYAALYAEENGKKDIAQKYLNKARSLNKSITNKIYNDKKE